MSITTAAGIGGFLLGVLIALICMNILVVIKKQSNPFNGHIDPVREEQLRLMANDIHDNVGKYSASKIEGALKDLIEEIDILREQIWHMIEKKD